MVTKEKISIIIPAYNEEKRIGRTLIEFQNYFSEIKKKEHLNFEILVVINNTKDNTELIVKNCQKAGCIRCLNFEQGGKGFAIIEGFKDALKRDNNLIGFVDADMSTSPEAFYDLVKNMEEYDGVIASRAIKGAKTKFSFKRKITHKGFNFIARSFFLFPYKDTQCGAKIFKREVIEKVNQELRITQWAFDINLLYLCKINRFKIKEHPTIWEDKEGSKMRSVPKISLQMFLGIVRLRLIYSIFERPLKPVKFILRFGDRLINK